MTGQHAGDNLGPADIPAASVTAVKVAGRDTVTFPAIRDTPQKCQCGTARCPDAPQPGPAAAGGPALLSCGPGVVTRMWRERVRNGQWLDISAEADAGAERVHKPAQVRERAIHNNLDCGWHDVAAVFRADTDLLTDPEVAERLRQFETGLAAQLAEMRLAAERKQAKRNEAEGQVAA